MVTIIYANNAMSFDKYTSQQKLNEYRVQWGAAFAVVSAAYLHWGDRKRSAKYKSRFDEINKIASMNLQRRGKDKVSLEKYMQMHIDRLTSMSGESSRAFADWVRFCEEKFPE